MLSIFINNVILKVIDIENEIAADSIAIEFLNNPNPTDRELHIKISGLDNLSAFNYMIFRVNSY